LKSSCFKYIPALFGRNFHFKILLLLILGIHAYLISGSRISGSVIDSNGDAVSDVIISVSGTAIGTISDENGKFNLPRLADGEYKIIFRHICCHTEYADISSGAEDRIFLDIVMKNHTLILDPIYAEALKDNEPHITLSTRELTLSGSKNAEEALRKVSGVNIEKVDGTRSRISVRGTDSKHTSVYIDGNLVNSPMDGSFDLASIPAQIIEKIEIYKTGDTTLSGRSVGGVISIATKKNSDSDEAVVSYRNLIYLSDRDIFGAGRLNNHEYSAGLKHNIKENHGLYFSFTGRKNENEWSFINAAKADEYRYINNPNNPRTQTNSYSYSDNIYASYNFSSKAIEGSAGVNYSTYKIGIPGWYDQPYYGAFSEKRDLIMSGSLVHNVEMMQYRIETSYSLRNDRTKIEEINPIYHVDSDNTFQNSGFRLHARYQSGDLRLRAGSEYSDESVESDDLDERRNSRYVISAYSKAEYKKKLNESLGLDTSAGLRKDIVSGTDFNRVLLSASVSPEFNKDIFSLTPSYSYSQSYSLPSFSDLFWAENLFSAGNPDLKPEYCVQHEASLTGIIDVGRVRFRSSYTYYDKELQDLIVWLKRVNGKYSPENFKEGRIRGHEISFTADIDEILSIKADYETMDARQFTDNVVTNDKFIIYKPVETLSISMTASKAGWHGTVRAKYNGKMYLNETNSIDIYPYRLFGADISKTLVFRKTEITVSAGGENLLDEQYQVIYGYPMPGRKIETGIKIKF
jgi:vitamin B12 transporter